MECNRDEAVRARTIAETKLTDKDYPGARKFALKAKNLYPGLEGLSQMFTILDVYTAAENKISGETDWYGVLGVNPTAEDDAIRKQYRKLALVLHPDKNKCIGADGAFKLLSEAWSLLSDKSKRLQYNQRRSSAAFNVKIPSNARPPFGGTGPSNGYHKFNTRAPHTKNSNPNAKNAPAAPPPPPPPINRSDTFWTICHLCKMHYEYLKIYLNNTLLCPNCQKAFVATEMAPPRNVPKPSVRPPHQRTTNSYEPSRKSAAASSSANQNSRTAGVESSNSMKTPWFNASRTPASSSNDSVSAKAASIIQQANDKLKREREEAAAAGSSGKKRKGLDDDGSVYGGKVPFQMSTGNNGAASSGDIRFYGSSRYNINNRPTSTSELSPLELRNMLMSKAQTEIRKKLTEWQVETDKEIKKEKEKEKRKANEESSKGQNGKSAAGETNEKEKVKEDNNGDDLVKKTTRQAKPVPPPVEETEEVEEMVMNVPDPDFHDFDLDRTEQSFKDNQVWAAYDNDDGMPRFYAMIQKVVSRKPFKMKISWLNSKSTSEFGELDWVGLGFYKTCGEYNVGRTELNKTLNSFSHAVQWTRAHRGRVYIRPQKEEVWALYRNWSPEWSSQTPDTVIHKYDMVKVVDNYSAEKGITVIPLVKVAGFKTVFQPNPDLTTMISIPNEEMFRFSHQVPSYVLTGQEAINAPKGCLELDPAATPVELLQVLTEDQVAVKGQNRPVIFEEEMVENGKRN
jgi:curved DNA-binding protein CbpA